MLISLLNALLSAEKRVSDLRYNPVEYPGSSAESRTAVFDLRCTGKKGEEFIVEMQRLRQDFFSDRVFYYTAMLASSLAKRGRDWDFMLPEINFIGILDFSFDDLNPETFLHQSHIRDGAPHYTVFNSNLGFTFLEIPKFKKSVDELRSKLDQWCYVFQNLGRLEEIPVFLNKKPFVKLFSLAEVANLTKEEYHMYESDLLAKQNQFAFLQSARNEGIKEGINEGKIEGEQKILRTIIKECMRTGELSIAQIARMTGQSEAVIRQIEASMDS